MICIATLPCHVKIEFSSQSLHDARNHNFKNQGKPKLTNIVDFHVRCKVPIIHLIILVVVVVVIVGVVTWAYTFFELHMKWATVRSGVQGLRALSFNVHKAGKKTCNPQFFGIAIRSSRVKIYLNSPKGGSTLTSKIVVLKWGHFELHL